MKIIIFIALFPFMVNAQEPREIIQEALAKLESGDYKTIVLAPKLECVFIETGEFAGLGICRQSEEE